MNKVVVVWTVCLLLLVAVPTFAGHGFMSSFGNIEWLPEPGRTPDSSWYWVDAWQEEGKLLLARTPEEKLRLCLTFAREKLAELEAMVRAENVPAATIAADQYRAYLDRAKQLISDEADPTVKESLVEMVATALLEHQYILSVVYEDLPAAARPIVLQVVGDTQERYQEVTKLLSPKKKGALFFKEEEVRWSVQMATRADGDRQ